MASEKQIFDTQILQLKASQGKNTQMLDSDEYRKIISRLNLLSRTPETRTPRDYFLMERLVKPDSTGKPRRRYITTEELYETIKKVHCQKKHTGRDLGYKALQPKFANVTKIQVQTYVNCCANCQVKKTRMKKSIVVKVFIYLFIYLFTYLNMYLYKYSP